MLTLTIKWGVYGKHFDSMYSGSMVGAGALMFALMGYIISTMKPDSKVGMQVELNPKLLAAIIGEDEGQIRDVIEKLCSPDAESRSKEQEGRRLVRLGQFDYQVVNGAKYDAIRNHAARREYNRIKKREERAKDKADTATIEKRQSEPSEPGAFAQHPPDPETQKMLRKDIEEYQIDGEICAKTVYRETDE